mmetsp:Transcript_21728/g.36356  ORF Transcript_21728/g.36356 Transcript_21728/m.36356 type:complete len:213 (-) Transcript_21728:105-743(-)
MNAAILFVTVGVLLCSVNYGFHVNSARSVQRSNALKMEYIPDGLSKEQWAAMKKKETEANKGKDLSKVGITKFKSRSFEAWQKSGQKHLFPVGDDVPLEERPYMQRQGGSADGEDLKKKGIFGRGQAAFSTKTNVDERYEKLEKEGKLRSSAFNVPWTSSAASKEFSKKRKETTDSKATKGKAKVVKGKATSTKTATPVKEEAPKKKGWFGF